MFTNAPCIAESTLCEPYVRSQPRQYAKWVNEPANRVKLLKIACKTMPAAPVENSIRLALSELTEAAHPEFSLWRREGPPNLCSHSFELVSLAYVISDFFEDTHLFCSFVFAQIRTIY